MEDLSLVCFTKSRHASTVRIGVCGIVRTVIIIRKPRHLHPVIGEITVPSVQLVLVVHCFQVSQALPTSKT